LPARGRVAADKIEWPRGRTFGDAMPYDDFHDSTGPQSAVLRAYLFGAVDFEDCLALQHALAFQVSGERETLALVLCEHPTLITVGRQGSPAHILCDREELRARRWPVRWVNRGGGCLLHLPGQLAIYSVVALDRHGLGLEAYVTRLHRVLAAVLDDFGVEARTRPGEVGLWVGQRLVAAVGVAVRDWVAYHGAFLNVNPDLVPFRLVQNGGPADGPMTSLVRERRGPVHPSLVRQRLLEHYAAAFGCERTSIFFHHPQLRRPSPADTVAAGF
jgi:lipoyl(octanoyl) transferase